MESKAHALKIAAWELFASWLETAARVLCNSLPVLAGFLQSCSAIIVESLVVSLYRTRRGWGDCAFAKRSSSARRPRDLKSLEKLSGLDAIVPAATTYICVSAAKITRKCTIGDEESDVQLENRVISPRVQRTGPCQRIATLLSAKEFKFSAYSQPRLAPHVALPFPSSSMCIRAASSSSPCRHTEMGGGSR